MYGVLLGDIIGSTYEFSQQGRNTPQIFARGSCWTDDSVCSAAVAKNIITKEINVAAGMREFCSQFLAAGYGPSFLNWLTDDKAQAYNSYGNGAIMRISPAALSSENIHEALKIAEDNTIISHNHPDALKAVVIYINILQGLLNNVPFSKMVKHFNDSDSFLNIQSVNDYIKIGGFHINSISTLERAIACVYESNSYEETVTKAIQIGSDTDTTAAIAGAMAELIYDIPSEYLSKLNTYFSGESEIILDYISKSYINSPFLNSLPANIKDFVMKEKIRLESTNKLNINHN